MFNKESFDFVAFIAWFESIIDQIIKLVTGIKAKVTTTEAAEEII